MSYNDQIMQDGILAILPYFPGGNGPCTFDRVYVGGLILEAPPVPNWKFDEITNITIRNNILARSKNVAQKFITFVANSPYKNVQWDWYLNWEIVLDFIYFDMFHYNVRPLTDGVIDYYARAMIDFNSLKPGRSFLTSPCKQITDHRVEN